MANIPAGAIHAAEEAVKDAMVEHGPDGHIDGYEEITLASLEAAAPHIRANALREAADSVTISYSWGEGRNRAKWLRDLAEQMEANRG